MRSFLLLWLLAAQAHAISPEIIWEKARAHYEAAEWEKFFGLATYARMRFPNAQTTESLRLLETLALLRHCQLDLARQAVAEALPLSSALKEDFLSLQVLVGEEKTSALDHMGHRKSPNAGDSLPGRNLWKLSPRDVEKLSPWSVRKPVASICEAQE